MAHALRPSPAEPAHDAGEPPEPDGFEPAGVLAYVQRVREPLSVLTREDGRRGVAAGRVPGAHAQLPPIYPEWLGDRGFQEVHRTRFPYIAGAMANGISTPALVIAMARMGAIGFFGAAGLPFERVEAGVDELHAALHPAGASWGANLIHSPNEPALEARVADLYVRKGVTRVSASAYMGLTPAIVHYAAAGLRSLPDGRVHRRNHVFAKISRPEVARRFMEPAPAELLQALVQQGRLSAEEAALAATLPVAEDITVEADSGGHTDNQPLVALLPTISLLRDQLSVARGYRRPIRVGAAGGLGTPASVAGAFALGAAYVLTGSVNQACVESGLSPAGRQMLAGASIADVVMAPAADMFEQGVEVQVLSRGTFFAQRGKKLAELYKRHNTWDEVPAADRARVERDILGGPFAERWQSTRAFWLNRDPREAELGDRDPRRRMALVFRAYLGLASRWAITGEPARALDYQIWCGPAMGAFNAWVKGSFLEDPAERTVTQVAKNLLEGAAVVTRAGQLRSYGLPVPAAAFDFRPRRLD